MTLPASFISDIEHAVAGGNPIRRVDAVRRVTMLFVEQAARLGEAHVEVFDEVILRLSRDLEQRARAELSDRLADLANAPRRTVRALADDLDIGVAGPVLERSRRLDDDALVAIAQRHGQEHLLALSRRPALSEGVTDVLVERGDERVARSIAGHAGARVSDRGFTRLVERARRDGALWDTLRGRSDLPPPCMARLVEVARERVRHTLQSEFGPGAEDAVDAALDGVARAVEGEAAADAARYAEAAARVRAHVASGRVGEDDVAQWIKAGRVPEALAAIAHLADLPLDTVTGAYHGAHHDPLMFIVRSVRFGWATFKLLLTTRHNRPLPPDVLKSAFEGFQQLSVQTAQRVVRFTAARERAVQTSAA